MEKIEEKALEKYPVHLVDEPNNHTMCAREVDINKEERGAFIDGFTTRNDEVVEMIEARINYLDGLNPINLPLNNTRILELTTLLQTIKGLDAPTKKSH